MADPTPYTISYSFAGWQAVNPDRPLPAPELDNELSNIQSAVQEIVDALQDVRRADANLQNSVVTWDALSDDVKVKIAGDLDDRIVVGDINPVAFATQTESEGGVANDKLMTPLRGKQQLDSLRAFSTQLQATGGANNATVMTPLRTKEQLDALRGFASEVEAQAGTSLTKVSSPQRVTDQLDALRKALKKSQSLTWGSVGAAGGTLEQTIAVPGAVAGERVALGLPASGIEAGLVAMAWVSAADTVKIRITNTTAGALTPHAGAATTYSVTVMGF
ncbi:hypothetical protein RZ532_00995 [Nitratireductor aquimarinus]|uniref:hypothetical protein n=1 Tax=Nitratireductor aquimarinus TaxID=889300 RepID=UPI002935FDF3|nr:hypothetical protein [Nitratireductor aquimarinus]MDV2964537.1 hypothetical protein [Nitratireductor aquimarinus]